MSFAPQITEELTSSELCAHLRIIAADDRKLSPSDRYWISCAANEIEIAYRQILIENASKCEAQAHNAALLDRVDVLARKVAMGQPMVWSSGAVAAARFP